MLKNTFLTCLKSEKSCRYKIFRSRALCRETAQSSADSIGENANFKALIRKALKCVFLLGAALTSGMVEWVKKE